MRIIVHLSTKQAKWLDDFINQLIILGSNAPAVSLALEALQQRLGRKENRSNAPPMLELKDISLLMRLSAEQKKLHAPARSFVAILDAQSAEWHALPKSLRPELKEILQE